MLVLAISRAGAMQACFGTQAVFPHESCHSLAPAVPSFGSQGCMNARTAIDLTMLQKDLLDIGRQTGIFSAMLARLSAFPGKIATLGDLERLAEHRDRVVVVVLGNKRKAQSWLREKMPSAFFRMSRSWRRVSTSRFKRLISSSCAV